MVIFVNSHLSASTNLLASVVELFVSPGLGDDLLGPPIEIQGKLNYVE